MKFNSFKTKIILLTASVFILSITVIIAYSSLSRLADETKNAEKNAVLMTEDLSIDLKIKIDYAFDVLRSISENLAVFKNQLDRNSVNKMLTTTLVNNPEFFATYTLWEPNAFDGQDQQFVNKEGHDRTGRFIPYWTRK